LSKDTGLKLSPVPQSAQGLFGTEEQISVASLSEKSDLTSPVLAHIHIPKTGGTSVVVLLQQAGKRHMNLYVNDTYHIYTPDVLAKDVLADRAIRSLSSHYVLTFPPYLGGRRMLYFTILRDPIQQFVSYLTFIKKKFKDIRDPNMLSSLPPDPVALTLREFAHWLLIHNHENSENYNVNFLTKEVYRSLQATNTQYDPAIFKGIRLTLAKAVLDQFVFVGLTERMSESIEELRKVLRPLGIEIPGSPIGNENVSSELRDDLKWTSPDDEVGALLHKTLEEDKELYNWAVERFESHSWLKRVERYSFLQINAGAGLH
jgi:Sulfotransferase family